MITLVITNLFLFDSPDDDSDATDAEMVEFGALKKTNGKTNGKKQQNNNNSKKGQPEKLVTEKGICVAFWHIRIRITKEMM